VLIIYILEAKVLNIFGYNRIIIVGNNGSGKSFLSKELSVITGLPLIHLDVEFWRPNWEKPPKEEWIKKQTELISKDKWIIDGNHTDTMELRFKSADLIIFLDINRFICLASIFKRYGKKRSDMPQYLEERLDIEFFKFFKGLWNFSKTRKCIIMDLHKKHPDKPFFVIESRRKMNNLLNQWRDEKDKYINPAL
jgi:adenylate kinase family enzyme